MAGSGITTLLELWPIGPTCAVREIHPGRVHRVDLEAGESLILKEVGSGTEVARRLVFEVDVLRHLDRAGVGVALPLPDRRGLAWAEHGGRLYTLSPCLDTDDPWSKLDRAGRVRLNRNCGAAIGRLHAALATYPAEGLEQRTWKTVLPDEWFERSIPVIREHLAPAEREALNAAIQQAAGEMRSAAAGLPQQLIHRDCHHGNIVVHADVCGLVLRDGDAAARAPRIGDAGLDGGAAGAHPSRAGDLTGFLDRPCSRNDPQDLDQILSKETGKTRQVWCTPPTSAFHNCSISGGMGSLTLCCCS